MTVKVLVTPRSLSSIRSLHELSAPWPTMMYQVFVALVCVCVGLPVREAVEIPPQWQAYIQQLLERQVCNYVLV